MTRETRDFMVVDLGATDHAFIDPSHTISHNAEIELPDGSSIPANTTTATTFTNTTEGTRIRLKFELVYAAKNITRNLLSLPQLALGGWEISLQRQELTSPDGITFQLIARSGLFMIQIFPDGPLNAPNIDIKHYKMHNDEIDSISQISPAEQIRHNPRIFATSVRSGLHLLHLRLAHFSERKIKTSIRYGAILGDENISYSQTDDTVACEGCLGGLAKRPTKKRNNGIAQTCGDLIHTDIKGPLPIASPEGHRYWIHFSDDSCGFTLSYSLEKKSDAPAACMDCVRRSPPQPRHPNEQSKAVQTSVPAMYIAPVEALVCPASQGA